MVSSQVDPCFGISANAAAKSRQRAAWHPVSPRSGGKSGTNEWPPGEQSGTFAPSVPSRAKTVLQDRHRARHSPNRGNPAHAQPVMPDERLRQQVCDGGEITLRGAAKNKTSSSYSNVCPSTGCHVRIMGTFSLRWVCGAIERRGFHHPTLRILRSQPSLPPLPPLPLRGSSLASENSV
jgi:hypothetical protein